METAGSEQKSKNLPNKSVRYPSRRDGIAAAGEAGAVRLAQSTDETDNNNPVTSLTPKRRSKYVR